MWGAKGVFNRAGKHFLSVEIEQLKGCLDVRSDDAPLDRPRDYVGGLLHRRSHGMSGVRELGDESTSNKSPMRR